VLIIAAEALCGLLLALGAAVLLVRLRAPANSFNRAKSLAVVGLTIGFGLWFFGFIVIGGEYFAMWQSSTWNVQEGAFRFVTMILGGLVFLSLPDGELT
jgi:predicted small integral membrane protein